jgi:hypothetical protein
MALLRGIKILESLRVAVCDRLVKTLKFGEAHMLGRITDICNHLSHSGAQIATAGRLLRSPNSLHKFLPRRAINYLEFGHLVGLWFGLSVKALNGRATKSGSCNPSGTAGADRRLPIS